jgi:hypothetical protein
MGAIQMVGLIIWGDGPNERKQFTSERELDRLIDHLTETAEAAQPFTVEIHAHPKTAMEIIVGLNISSLLFSSATESPQNAGSRGSWTGDEWIEFLHRGEPSEKPIKCFIPVEVAREAVREYFRTGQLPKHIQWSNFT